MGPHILVYQIKYLSLSIIVARKDNLGVLPKRTPPAYLMMLSVELWQSCHNLPQHPQNSMMQVSHPFMPNLTQLIIVVTSQSM
jgi:hypothetical protein